MATDLLGKRRESKMTSDQARNRPKLPTHLKLWKYEIERLGRKNGLDFNPNMIIMADHEEISELAAYGGYPVRYHHWSFGQESIKLKKSYRWGLHIIYEMVIPTVPCYSYFLDANPDVIQKAVMAHACVGHNDFFKNNVWFADIPKNLHHHFGDNAEKVEELRREVGKEKVDEFLEACLSLSNLFNLLEPMVETPKSSPKRPPQKRTVKRITSLDELPFYMDDYINPPEYLEKEREKIKIEEKRESDIEHKRILPAEPVRNLLGFLIEHASLDKWQQEIARIVKEETLALYKGAQTKIMNEGWAAYWEAEIMAGQGAANASEACSFAKAFAEVQGGSRFSINPYKLGKQLWDHINLRWNTGRHGDIWENCRDRATRDRWEEFIVFKSLFDEFGKSNERVEKTWNEFTTLVHETVEGRGFINNAFFTKDSWVLEWLRYREAEQKLIELKDALDYIEQMEDKHKTDDESELACLELRHNVATNSLHPYFCWSSEELKQEIAHYEFCVDLRNKICSGVIPVHNIKIPVEWVAWAEKHQLMASLGYGRKKMFEVRKFYNDVNFIQDFFDQDFCDKHKYYTFGIGKPEEFFWGEDRIVIKSRNYKRVKRLLLQNCVNLGQPKIVLLDANYQNNSELRLVHLHGGRDICYDGCGNCRWVGGIKEVLEKLYLVWNKGKLVWIETIETIWPEKKPPWYYWQMPGMKKPELGESRYTWMRYSYSDTGHYEDGLNDIKDIPDIERIRQIIPFFPKDLVKYN